MSAARRDHGPDQPKRIPAKRARTLILVAIVVVALVVFGYLILVGGLVGD
jgi:hypothetical protein